MNRNISIVSNDLPLNYTGKSVPLNKKRDDVKEIFMTGNNEINVYKSIPPEFENAHKLFVLQKFVSNTFIEEEAVDGIDLEIVNNFKNLPAEQQKAELLSLRELVYPEL